MEETINSYWEAWIENNTTIIKYTSYDKIAEMAIYSYSLSERSRKEELIDKKHCFIIWWGENRNKFKRYSSLQKISKALNIHHATTLHHLNTRKKSLRFNENVSCLLDFLTS
jgi:hypothetical protein